MKKFIIISDSCCNLSKEVREKYDIDYLPMHVSYKEKSMPASLDWEEWSPKEYYDIMRGGTRIFSSQVTANDFRERFEKYIKEGYDVLYISCSSALSASINASIVVRDELKQKYPEAKIICIDSLISSFGEGMLCMYASKLRKEGKDIEEVAEAVEKIKTKINQMGTVDELKFLKMAGRISASKALFGSLLNVKPIIISSAKGENVSTEKTKGRANSVNRLAELTIEKYTGEEIDGVYISHGDCLEDAEKVKALVLEKLPNVNVTIDILNPSVGASCGPKMLAVYFVGQSKPEV